MSDKGTTIQSEIRAHLQSPVIFLHMVVGTERQIPSKLPRVATRQQADCNATFRNLMCNTERIPFNIHSASDRTVSDRRFKRTQDRRTYFFIGTSTTPQTSIIFVDLLNLSRIHTTEDLRDIRQRFISTCSYPACSTGGNEETRSTPRVS